MNAVEVRGNMQRHLQTLSKRLDAMAQAIAGTESLYNPHTAEACWGHCTEIADAAKKLAEELRPLWEVQLREEEGRAAPKRLQAPRRPPEAKPSHSSPIPPKAGEHGLGGPHKD